MKFRPLLSVVAVAGLLSACGGGVGLSFGDFGFDDFDDDAFPQEPFHSGRPASATVSNAGDPAFDGTYSAPDARVSSVFRYLVDDTCRFQFEGLRQGTSDRLMRGEIHYLPGTNTVARSFIVIDSREFRLDGGNAATVDRVNNAVSYDGARLTETQGLRQAITLSGSIPLRDESRPSGC